MKKMILLLVFLNAITFAQVVQTELGVFPEMWHTQIPSATTINNKAYFFGGRIKGSDPYQCVTSIYEFDIVNETWQLSNHTLPFGTDDMNCSAHYYENKFYFGPGWATGNTNGWGSHNKLIEVDFTNNTSSEINEFPGFSKIWGSAGCSVGSDIYFFGGHNGSDQTEIFKFDVIAGTFIKVADMKSAKNIVSSVYTKDGWIYYWEGDTYASDKLFEKFNPLTNEVVQLSAILPYTDRAQPAIRWYIESENAIYFFSSNHDNPTVYKYDILSDAISNTGYTVEGNFLLTSAVVDENDPNTIYVLKLNANNTYPLILSKLELNKKSITPLPFADNFDSGIREEWSVIGNNWSFSNGTANSNISTT